MEEPRGGVRVRALKRHANLVALAAFALLTLAMTYPNALRLTDGVKDLGDPLLNTWIMWWEVDSVTRGDFAGFFDANIFFPHDRALAYSELLIPQTLVAAPILLLSGNPLLAYNAVLLLSFVATAFAMYLLGRHLTGSALAGFIGGLVLAYSPFMFSHVSHIQVIGAAGFPLAFLFLHRYFDSGSLKYLLGFTAAFVGQALANGYYAIYLTYAAGAYILYRAVQDRRLMKADFWLHMGLHAILSLVVLAPFYLQYLALREELGFVRAMSYNGGFFSFLAAPPINRLYGSITEPFQASEAMMFPGITVAALAIVGVFAGRNRSGAQTVGSTGGSRGDRSTRGGPRRARGAATWAYRLAGLLIAAGWSIIIAISVTGGFDETVLGVHLRANNFTNPLIGLGTFVALRAVLRRTYPGVGREGNWLEEPQRFYAWMVALALLFSLGPDGLYRLLYSYVPGFNGIRAVARIYIVAIFGMAVLAAYGSRALSNHLSGRGWATAGALFPALICVEFFSAPLPLVDAPGNGTVPPAYEWLAAQEGDFAAIEYPIDIDLDYQRLYFSMFHSKKIVNGMSGYQAPIYREMRRWSDSFPSGRILEDIRHLGLRWVIVHPGDYGGLWPAVSSRLREHGPDLDLVARFDDALVYEVRGTKWNRREDFEFHPVDSRALWTSLPRDGWTVAGIPHDFKSELAIDGDLSTGWDTDLQKPGDYLEIAFGQTQSVGGVVMAFDAHPHDYPRGYRVEVSEDGLEWHSVAEDPDVHLPITDFLYPRLARLEMQFPESRARYLRIVQTGEDPNYFWSVFDVDIRTRRAPAH